MPMVDETFYLSIERIFILGTFVSRKFDKMLMKCLNIFSCLKDILLQQGPKFANFITTNYCVQEKGNYG